jgi:glycosyltransferase involved in cell wall biosynthesis
VQKRFINEQMSLMKKKLAIVIPAYKANFLEDTLQSIANQTCMDFTLYIGNDASPNNLYDIVSLYENKIDIVYKYFENNLGGKDLISHWNRCIDMSIDEEWIWLFSDDDIMELNCVECFYNELALNSDLELFHFNVKVINDRGLILEESHKFPKKLTVESFFLKRIKYELHSFIVEYVFRRELYLKKDKFQNFDLAWCSDDATWIKFGLEKGIYTISNSSILWRYSDVNISSFVKEKTIVLRKLDSAIQYIKWVESNFNFAELDKNKLTTIKWILGSINNGISFSLKFRIEIYKIVYTKMCKPYDLKIILWMLLSLSKGIILKRLKINKR